MKTQKEIKDKLKQVLFRHYKDNLNKSLSRVCTNCSFNKPLSLEGITPVMSRFCSNENRMGWVCDPVFGDLSDVCPLYEPLASPQELKTLCKEELDHLTKQPISSMARYYPDAAALRWVLEDALSPSLTKDEEEPTEAMEASTGEIPTPLTVSEGTLEQPLPLEIQEGQPTVKIDFSEITTIEPFYKKPIFLWPKTSPFYFKVAIALFYISSLFGF